MTGQDAVAKAGIYSDNSGAPDALSVASSEVTITSSAGSWFDFTIADTALTASTDYWLAVIIGTQECGYFYDAGTNNQQANNADTYSDGFADPFGSPSYNDRDVSIYCTYSPLRHLLLLLGAGR